MNRVQRRILIGLTLTALATSSLDVLGATWWRRTAAVAAVNSTAAVNRLVGDLGLSIPEAIRRSRRFAVRDLAQAPPDDVAEALSRLGHAQRRWFESDPIGFKNDARAAMVDGRLLEAVGWLEGAILRDPTSPSLHRLMALLHLAEGELDEAKDHMAEAYALAPSLRSPTVELVPEDEQWVRSEGLRRALDLYPRQRTRTVLVLAGQLRHDGLEEQGRAVLERELPHPEVELALARWDRESGALDDARSRLQRVATRRAYPASIRARAWSQLAETEDLAGDRTGAEAAAREALALDPTSTAPYLALAHLAQRRGDYHDALRHLRGAWGLDPADTRLLVRVSKVAEKAGETADARLALERAVELDPDSPQLAARLVDFYIRNGLYMEALLRLDRFKDRFPTDARILRLGEELKRELNR